MASTNWSNGFKVSNVSTTQGPFELLGGKYGVTCHATFGGGTVDVSILAPDGTTYIPINQTSSHTFSADGYFAIDLPPCEIEVVPTTATAVYVSVIPISNRR
jgi:hypothetical protein